MEQPFTYAESAMRRLGIVGRAARRLVMGRVEGL
jgi:hypothetical protein